MAAIGIHHAHLQGEFMIGYSYTDMKMKGNRNGANRIPIADVLSQYMISPTRMTMRMHLLHAMYAPTDNVTLMLMAPYRDVSMDHVTRGGQRFTTEAKGLGDLKVDGMFTIFRSTTRLGASHRAHLQAGASLPTGSISKRGTTPMGPDQKLPYPMQLEPEPSIHESVRPTWVNPTAGSGEPARWQRSESMRTTKTIAWETNTC